MTDICTYRLSIAPSLESFRPELEYSCDFLDRCHFLKRVPNAPIVLHYGEEAPKGAIAVPAQIFPAGVRVDEDGIHPDLRKLPELLAAMGPADTPGDLSYDALGLVFCQLSRLEERGAETQDRYGRFESQSLDSANSSEPPADRAARDLAIRLTGNGAPRNRTSYSVMLTHDVDRLRGYHRPLAPIRPILGDLIKRFDPGRAVARAQDAWFSGEPWRSVRMLMRQSESRDLKSHFYFMGPSDSAMDSPYAATMTGLLRQVTNEIQQRGHVIGFHPGFGTAVDSREWNRQRAGLEAVIGHPVREGRQHVLGYDALETPDIWDAAGMELDTTLGFPEQTGFRSGTCRRFSAYSLRHRKRLQLEQLSTAIMDFGLLGGKYRDLSVEAALEECEKAAKICRDFGGTLVILYHTGQTRKPLTTFYEQLLDRVA